MNVNRIIILVVIGILIILLCMPLPLSLRLKLVTRDGFAPYQNIMAFLYYKTSELVNLATTLHTAIEERNQFATQIVELKQEIQRLQSLADENDQLKKMLGYYKEEGNKYKLLLCRVISRGDISGWWQNIRLNRGSKDGIAPNMAVVTEKGLIGKVVEVSEKTSEVLLITDINSMVSCKFKKTGALGILKGKGFVIGKKMLMEALCIPRPFIVDYIPNDQEIGVGDEVVTSGLGGVFPPDIKIGVVERFGKHTSGLYQCAEVVPYSDMISIKYVFVIVGRTEEGSK